MDTSDTVFIEQKLETQAKFLFFTADDALVFLAPCAVGFLAKALIEAALVALVLFFLWRKLKGEGGLERLVAALYWYTPAKMTPFKSFPASHVIYWRG